MTGAVCVEAWLDLAHADPYYVWPQAGETPERLAERQRLARALAESDRALAERRARQEQRRRR